MVQAAPGSYWYIFGEPNRYSDPNLTGARFATVFDYFATEIKQADPTAKIVSPSILNWETVCGGCWYPPGLDWLSEFIAAYQGDNGGALPPVDIWAIDLYPIDWFDTPNSEAHAPTVFDQLAGFRGYLNGFTEYANTPIWISEIAIHVGYEGWTYGPSSEFIPIGAYRWDEMSDYMIAVLDWLEVNAASNNVEKWFFFTSWTDIVNVDKASGYMGIIFFDDPGQGAPLNCLGLLYRARAQGEPRVKCDINGNSIPE